MIILVLSIFYTITFLNYERCVKDWISRSDRLRWAYYVSGNLTTLFYANLHEKNNRKIKICNEATARSLI